MMNAQNPDYAFIDSFHRQYRAARSHGGANAVLHEYCTLAIARHCDIVEDAEAIDVVARVFDERVPQDWREFVDNAKRTSACASASQHRTRRATSTLVALWSLEIVTFYKWHDLSYKSLETLVEVSGTHLEWSDFILYANCAMIWRHEQSVSTNRRLDSIGQHTGNRVSRGVYSPLQACDIDMMQTMSNDEWMKESMKELMGRIDRWLQPCSCLSIGGKQILDDQFKHLSLGTDRYGMLSPARGRKRTSTCTHCSQKTSVQLHSSRGGCNSKLKRKSAKAPRRSKSKPWNGGKPRTRFLTPPASPDLPSDNDELPLHTIGPGEGTTSDNVIQSTHCCAHNGPCKIAVIPQSFDQESRKILHGIAEDIVAIAADHEHENLQNFVSPVRFAALFHDEGQELCNSIAAQEADAWVLSDHQFRQRADRGERFPKPVILRESFNDAGLYSASKYADIIRTTYTGMEIPIRDGLESVSQSVDDFVQKLLSPESRGHLNALSLDDMTNAGTPILTKLPRFGLLDRLVRRAKGRLANGSAGKQTTMTPWDINSCLRFNILGFRGAFSGPHRDSLGGTWLRCLFGQKVWWIIANDTMAGTDWGDFGEHGPAWNPGDKARALLLRPNDVLVMPHENPTIHAVLTLNSALMNGGMFWDEEAIEPLLSFLRWTAEHPSSTNEPLAFQLPSVIHELGQVAQQESVLQGISNLRYAYYHPEFCAVFIDTFDTR